VYTNRRPSVWKFISSEKIFIQKERIMVEQNTLQDQCTTRGDSGQQQRPPAPPKPRSGCWKYGGIGCLIIIILAIIGGYFAYKGVKGVLGELAEKYTSVKPMDLPKIDASQDEVASTMERVGSFTNSLKGNTSPEPLTLTSRDINLLIQNHPEWKEMAGKLYVTIEGDQVKGQVSMPLGEMADMFKGRFLNGSASFNVGMESGRLLMFINSAEVGGKAIPAEIMNALRAENLAKKSNEKPEVAAIINKLESITVKDGSMIITPKGR
jgi:hypothetical protein